MMSILLFFLFVWIPSITCIKNILDFGAIKGVDTVAAQIANSKAIKDGILAANAS